MRISVTALRTSGLLPALLLSTLPSLGQTSTTNYPVEAVTPAENANAPTAATDSEDESSVPAERGAVYARLRHFEGGISLKREDDSSSEEVKLDINSPLIPGDQVWTGEDGRMEIQLADGAILRLDRNSRLSLLNLADRQAAFDNTTLVRLLNGSLYVRADSFDAHDRRFQIDTPAGSIYLLSGGVFRIDVGPDGVSTVASYRGVAEILSEDISVMAHSGERVTAEPGRRPGDARAFNTLRRDPFDVWMEARDDSYAANNSGRGARPEVPEPVSPYASELGRYGTWRQDPSYGWVWAPDNVASDWRPYYYGQWNNAPIGLTWVSTEPWGWAPYHYGRWSWSVGVGWFWVPGVVYSGAYVSWAVGPTYFGWVPLGYYNTPVYYNNYYPWVYVPHSYIYYPNVCHHSYSYSDVARYRLGQNSVVLRGHPYGGRGARPENFGATTYRRALANPNVAQGTPGGTGDRGGTPFKVDEQRSYRRALMSRPAAPEQQKTYGGAAAARGGSPGRSPRATPVSYRPNQGFDRFQDRSQGSARPEAMNGKRDLVSPVTGRPARPPVRMLPEAGQISSNRPSPHQVSPTAPSIDSNARGPAPRGRFGDSGSVAPPSTAPRPGNRSGEMPAAIPHPRAGGGPSGGGSRPFVMPMRPSNQGGPGKAPSAHAPSSGNGGPPSHASSHGGGSSSPHAVAHNQKSGGGGRRK